MDNRCAGSFVIGSVGAPTARIGSRSMWRRRRITILDDAARSAVHAADGGHDVVSDGPRTEIMRAAWASSEPVALPRRIVIPTVVANPIMRLPTEHHRIKGGVGLQSTFEVVDDVLVRKCRR